MKVSTEKQMVRTYPLIEIPPTREAKNISIGSSIIGKLNDKIFPTDITTLQFEHIAAQDHCKRVETLK